MSDVTTAPAGPTFGPPTPLPWPAADLARTRVPIHRVQKPGRAGIGMTVQTRQGEWDTTKQMYFERGYPLIVVDDAGQAVSAHQDKSGIVVPEPDPSHPPELFVDDPPAAS